jgi:hypothetical protein
MDWAGVAEDLVLLVMNPRKGRVRNGYRSSLSVALTAVELAALEAAGCVRMAADLRLRARTRDRSRLIMTVPDRSQPEPAELRAALAGITTMKYPPAVGQWLGMWREGLVTDYMERLAASGVVTRRTRSRLGRTVTMWPVTDWDRFAGARSRLDAAATSHGEADPADALYAGLAQAIEIYMPATLRSQQAQARLQEVSASCWLTGVAAARIEQIGEAFKATATGAF